MRRLPALLPALALAGFLAAPAAAASGRIAVGIAADAPRAELAERVAAATGGHVVHDLGALDALVLRVPDVRRGVARAAALPEVEYAEPVTATRRLANDPPFEPADPLYPDQWYLPAVRAFEHWTALPPHAPVRVAVIDSGVDGGHPDLAGRIGPSRSFVGGSPLVDTNGHGTMVAGLIAAGIDDGTGIAGLGIGVELMVAKVVGPGGGISVANEARAIRWAVNNGARVINLSLGGPRDPTNKARDTYSALEHAAIDFATKRNVLVVAAAGNCLRLRCPEKYANYPAALPHVIGVAAHNRSFGTPVFSNRDRRHVDLAAPGVGMISTYPRSASKAGCTNPDHVGYTPCAARSTDQNPSGTSFAAPLASAAAAVLLGERRHATGGLGTLHASQLTALLERRAVDIGPPGRDARSGWGRLDLPRSLAGIAGPPPPRDRFEPNDDAGPRAVPLKGKAVRIQATLDPFEDPRDVYRIPLRKGQRVDIRLHGPVGGRSNLFLWRPKTRTLDARPRVKRANRLRRSVSPGWNERIVYRAKATGGHFLEVRQRNGRWGQYTLTILKG